MEMWEVVLNKFIDEWKNRSDVIAILVCGSYITGKPSKRSDLDIHIILSDDVDWRERGNKIIDGLLIEYFVNPPRQIRNYFQDDYRDRRTMSMVQFITGKVLFDKHNVTQDLKTEAQEWINKKYENTNQVLLEIKKYGIWDTWDNLQDCYEQQRPDFHLVYYNSLSNLFDQYCTYLGLELIPHYQIHSYLSDPKYKEKYLKETFPDTIFSNMFIEALEENVNLELMKSYGQLTQYVLNKMGGFEIDGWKIKSPVESSLTT
ncbi:nucleotidyltransferase domain-containing protein [Peribacillus simplex]|uniref:nucleotidyltransferase domain-containing protein n=1 Tax=Peribacillus simplex TaxID=1478 RepID=UPI00298E734F|nr:nucleotidyltransferase domain-containing protein [Peribacillus simplex]MDW7617338.1 nucleotidyltransferase domain-containing protein [Peribacillus simplex]